MKLKKIFTILLFLFFTLIPLGFVYAQQDMVTATVTVGVISVSITPNSFNYGVMSFNEVKDSYDVISLPDDVKNIKATVSVVATDLYIKGLDTSSWILADMPGNNQYIHRFGLAADKNTRPSLYANLTTANTLLESNIAPNSSIYFGMQINTPTSGITSQQSAGVIVTAFHAN